MSIISQLSARDSGASQVQNADPNQVVTVPQNIFHRQRPVGAKPAKQRIAATDANHRAKRRHNIHQLRTQWPQHGPRTLADGNTVNTADVPGQLEFSSTITPASAAPTAVDERKKLNILDMDPMPFLPIQHLQWNT